jgi:hypothetical protein
VAFVVPPRPRNAEQGAPEAEEEDGGVQMRDDDERRDGGPRHARRGREHERGRRDGHRDKHGRGRGHGYGFDGPEPPPPTRGVKELVATPILLGGDYAPPPPPAPEPTLGLELVQGSDARNFSNVTATIKLTNHDKTLRRIYFRRELVSFQVTGPDGTVTCDPQPDERAPDRMAYTALNAGGSINVTSRLAELCPGDAFQRPGLYVIEAQLDAFATGSEHGFDAFVGKLVSSRTVVVRVRTGTLPFPGQRVVETVRVGAP